MSDQAPKAGWYRQGDRGRYWDGSAWTDDYRDLAEAPPAAGSQLPEPGNGGDKDSTTKRRNATIMVIGGAAAVALGSFLPWIKITAPFVGTLTKSGVDDGGDGVFFVGAAIAIAGLAWRTFSGGPSRKMKWGMAALIIAAGLTFFYELSNISTRFSDAKASSDLIVTSYGSGLTLIAVGLLVSVAGWNVMPWSSTMRPSP